MIGLFNVENKIVLITGSTRGLGLSLAKGFSDAGATVIINGRKQSEVDSVVKHIQDHGGQAYGAAFDVTKAEDIEESIQNIEKEVGPISVLINNAGIHRRNPLEELSLEDWQTVLDVNLTSAFNVSKLVFPYMKKHEKGKIINITSLNAEKARPNIANYSAAKGGLKMLTKSMATEWGPYNIQTNAIGPGYFKTDMTEKLVNDHNFNNWVKSEVPLQRWGVPEELIGTAIYLASDASNYVNGHTVYVDGGWQASL
ncbi:3-oxoacyl-ACP reductase FabG [Piscibacillus halophilus]|uniref:Gluconate 5-dehydrogenase n=1 Tax=Piscibacillus halophilus TaxID=571933 RepID=A0A1H9K4W1_9BACI|nr:3-oxoacyl-ACP reductase FabG [Piscibacillus halophilus]SEQ94078.1 gluconate 5-dehydrogenase [Piscibacillus halophilus]